MTLRHDEPPAESRTAAEEGVRGLVAQGLVGSPALRRATPARLELTRPHRMYLLGLDDLRAGRGLDAVRPVAWRYLVEQDGELLATVETLEARDGGHALGQVSYGPFVAGTAAALEAVERQAASTEADVRLLHIPALYLVAVWLHRADGDDALVPAAPTPTGIEPDHLYPASELLDVLAGRAAALPDMGIGSDLGI